MNVRIKLTPYLPLMILAIFTSSVLAQANWPTWRGIGLSGVSPDGNPPVKWSESENIKWKVALKGDGSNSTPVVWGNKIIFLEAVKTDKADQGATAQPQPSQNSGRRGGMGGGKPTNIYQFNVVCLNRANGQPVWEKTVTEVLPHEGHHNDHGFVSYSPVTDGKLIWANFGSRGLYCLDMEGNIKWSKELPQMTIRAGFGEGGSATLVDDKLIILCDHEGDSFIAAFNKITGDPIWRQSRDERTSWTTPFIVEANGKPQIVVACTNLTRAYDPANGNVIWECGGQTDNVIPTPVAGFNMVFCTSGYRGSKLQAIKLGHAGDLTGTDAIAWEVNTATPYVPSPLLYQDKLYVLTSNNNVVSCYNAQTGQNYYQKQNLDGLQGVYASPAAAAGRVYFIGRNGATCVIKNSDKLEVLALNQLDDRIDCSPVIVGNELYLKGKKSLYCIAE